MLPNDWMGRVAYGGGRFVASRSDMLWTSDDGRSWGSLGGEWRDITQLGGTFVVAIWVNCDWAASFSLMSSEDLTNWTSRVSGITGGGLRRGPTLSLIASEDRYVAASDRTIYQSADGTNWTEQVLAEQTWINDLAYGDGAFLAVGRRYQESGIVLMSTNGVAWESQVLVPQGTLNRLTFDGEQFTARGEDWSQGRSVRWVSRDGRRWASEPWRDEVWLERQVRVPGLAVAVGGEDGRVYLSRDGERWLGYTMSEGGSIRGVVYDKGRLVATGGRSGLWYSSPVVGLEMMVWTAEGHLKLRLTGPPGITYRIERSADLVQWEGVATVPMPDAGQMLLDPATTAEPFLFYRAVSVP